MSNELIKSSALKDIVQRQEVKDRLKEIMGSRSAQFAAALVQIVNQSATLQKCEPNSVIGAALTAAALDLSIDPNLGEAHIVPYGEKAQFQIGYIGYNQLAMRSGQYKNLGWVVVHKGELVKYDELSGELEVNSEHADEEVIGYAAKFVLINGFQRGLYWTKERCMKHAEKYSKAYKAGLKNPAYRSSVWWTDPDRACLKTVLKMLLKLWGPKSIQMQKALKMDDAAVIDVDSEEVAYIDTEQEPSKPEFKDKPSDKPKEKMVSPLIKPADKPKEAEADVKLSTTVDKIKELLAGSELTEKQLTGFLNDIGVIEGVKTLEEITEQHKDVAEMVIGQWADISTRIKQ